MSALNVRLNIGPTNLPIKKSSKLDLLGPPTDSHGGNMIGDSDIPIAVMDDPNQDVSSTSCKRQRVSPLFKSLEAQGFR
jgi:hypothetical protein